MKYDGTNLVEVLESHSRWYHEEGTTYDTPADFSGADLRGIALCGANLYGANFHGANLSSAILAHCDLRRADLLETNRTDTDFYKASFRDTKIEFFPLSCPETGSFIAWKKGYYYSKNEGCVGNPAIIKLLIPDDAERVSGTDRVCRASKAKVLEIQSIDGECLINEDNYSGDYAVSMRNEEFPYIPGETVVVENFQRDRFAIIHGPGIYFFINRQDCIDYMDFRQFKADIRNMIKERQEEINV